MTTARRLTAALTALLLAAGAAVAVLAAGVVLGASPAQAADNGEWSAFPKTAGGRGAAARDYFFYDLAPGQELTDTVVIRNNTTLPLPLTVYGADAFNTPQGGGFALRQVDDEQTDVGSWITVAEREVVVPPAKRKGDRLRPGKTEVTFTIKVPRNASPGDHAGGVVTLDTRPRPSQNPLGNEIALRRANGVRVYARVSGPLSPQLSVTDVRVDDLEPAVVPFLGDQGSATVSFTVVNSGNVRINPTGSMTLKGLLGRTLHKVDSVTVPEILPGQSVTLSQQLSDMPSLDQVTARVELQADELADPVGGDTSAWSVSWVMLVILLLLVIALIGYFVHRRRQPAKVVRAEAVPDAGLRTGV